MTQQINNYRVEKVNEADSAVAYKLHGQRGKVINLVKNQNEEGLYFMVNAKTWKDESIDGFGWVKEQGEELKLIKLL